MYEISNEKRVGNITNGGRKYFIPYYVSRSFDIFANNSVKCVHKYFFFLVFNQLFFICIKL